MKEVHVADMGRPFRTNSQHAQRTISGHPQSLSGHSTDLQQAVDCRKVGFWAFLIAGRDRPEWIFDRMRSLREYYHDGIGVCMFRFEDGQYIAYEGSEFDEFDVDVAIDEIIALI